MRFQQDGGRGLKKQKLVLGVPLTQTNIDTKTDNKIINTKTDNTITES